MTVRPRSTIGGRLSSIFGVVLLPLVLAVLAAEIYLAVRERRPAHRIDGHVVTPFPSESEAAVLSLRKQFVSAYPFVAPQQFFFRSYERKTPDSALFPLAGISRVTTELCNEDGRDIIYKSDVHGFDNPNGVWTAGKPDVALIGDSFVHGICVPTPDQLATLIRQAVPATLNLGVLGSGPLSELAVLREYAAPLQPRTVVWFFYEGNDIEDLAREMNSPLSQYLDPTYSQNLSDQQPAIDSILSSFADSVLSGESTMTPGLRDLPRMLTLPRVRKAIGMVVSNAPHRIDPREFATLDSVLVLATAEVNSWGGRLFFVYLPDYHRFDPRVLAYSGYVHNNAEIQRAALASAARADIPVIDVAGAFAADPNPRKYWPRPTSHYGPNGYALVARMVISVVGSM